MKAAFVTLLLLQSFVPPPRAALENPAAATAIPKPLQKDYNKLWMRFVSAKTPKDDTKVASDTTSLLKKNKDFSPLLILQAYLAFNNGPATNAERAFSAVVVHDPKNRIALYYLAEMAYARSDYLSASDLYTRLLAVDPSHPELEPKLQRASLLAADGFLRSASQAEENGRLPETEDIYRQALLRTPMEAELHGLLGAVLLKEKKLDEALAEFQRQIALAGPSDEAQRHVVEALTSLGRIDEARELSNRIGGNGRRGSDQELADGELENLGRWGTDIAQFRAIESTAAVTREQFAALMVRYFPQIEDVPRLTPILTDVQNSWASSEIQIVVGLGILDPLANHTFQPSRVVTRGEFAVAMSLLTRIVGATPKAAAPIPTSDLVSSSVLYPDVQLVLGYGLLSLDNAGKFGTDAPVTGKEAVNAEAQMMRVSKSFQQNHP